MYLLDLSFVDRGQHVQLMLVILDDTSLYLDNIISFYLCKSNLKLNDIYSSASEVNEEQVLLIIRWP